MAPRGYVLTRDEARAFNRMRRDHRRQGPPKARRKPRRRSSPGGGNCSCLTVHEIRLEGSVTSGTFTLGVSVNDGSTITTETVTCNWDDDNSEVETAYLTHSKIASGDILVKGGPFPNVAMYVVFLPTGDINFTQRLPTPNAGGLSGTNVRVKVAYMTDADWTEA